MRFRCLLVLLVALLGACSSGAQKPKPKVYGAGEGGWPKCPPAKKAP